MDASSILYGSCKEKLLERATPFRASDISKLKAMQYLAKVKPDKYRLVRYPGCIELLEFRGEYRELGDIKERIYSPMDNYYFSSPHSGNCKEPNLRARPLSPSVGR